MSLYTNDESKKKPKMNITLLYYRLKILVCFTFIAVFSTSALASVKYTFVVSELPTGDFHKPLFAEMVLSDAAVSTGQARNGQVESLVFGGGSAMQEINRITLAYLHSSFVDLTVKLSADRKTITAISAKLNNDGSSIDNWVFHYQRPPHPTLNIHEFVGYIRSDSIALETTILPVPPTTHLSNFKGHWQRTPGCLLCRYICRPIYVLPYCWLDWIIIISLLLIPVVLLRRLIKKSR